MDHPESQVPETFVEVDQQEDRATTVTDQSLDAEAVTNALLRSAHNRVLKACGSYSSIMSALVELSDAEEELAVVQVDAVSDAIVTAEPDDQQDHKRFNWPIGVLVRF